jgi:hypothetical protein
MVNVVGVEVEPEVVPVVGVAVSQLALEVTVKAVAVEAARLMDWLAGVEPPDTWEN